MSSGLQDKYFSFARDEEHRSLSLKEDLKRKLKG
jgi:hypothetical protein